MFSPYAPTSDPMARVNEFLGDVVASLDVKKMAAQHYAAMIKKPRMMSNKLKAEACKQILGASKLKLLDSILEESHLDIDTQLSSLNEVIAYIHELLSTEAQTHHMQAFYAGQNTDYSTDDRTNWVNFLRYLDKIWEIYVDMNAELPDLDSIFNYLYSQDPAAFWNTYWKWMLNADGQVVGEDTLYILYLPQHVLHDKRRQSKCRDALEYQIDLLPFERQETAKQTELMVTALAVTAVFWPGIRF